MTIGISTIAQAAADSRAARARAFAATDPAERARHFQAERDADRRFNEACEAKERACRDGTA